MAKCGKHKTYFFNLKTILSGGHLTHKSIAWKAPITIVIRHHYPEMTVKKFLRKFMNTTQNINSNSCIVN